MRCKSVFLFSLIILIGGLQYAYEFVFTQIALASTVTVETTVLGCGDGIIQIGEECDGVNLAGQTCVTRGFAGGFLSCNPNCTLNTTQCTAAPPVGGGGGGGGGIIPLLTGVRLSGRAYPGRAITVLRDAQIIAVTVADANANFQVSVTGISAGDYIFGVYSEDKRGIRSSLLTFPVSVTSGVVIDIGGIFIAPTIDVDKIEVRRGDNIAIFGQSAPDSEVTIFVTSPQEFFSTVRSDRGGVYLYNFDTTPLDMGQHFARSKAAVGGNISSFSKAVGFEVGRRNVVKGERVIFLRGDLNADGRVNLIDFSIAAYWYKRRISAEFRVIERERLNGDGRVNLVDFSIMAFHWTG